MTNWIAELERLAALGEPAVLLTVATVRGSAPREVGAKMIVTGKETIGTIGGGQLEYQCVRIACDQLKTADQQADRAVTRRFALGAGCGQCCGGIVDVLFEYLPAAGAGWLVELGKMYGEYQPVVIATSLKAAARKILLTGKDRDDAPAEIIVTAQRLLADNEAAMSVGGYLLEPVRASNFHIAIFGAGHVGAATIDVLSRLDCSIRWIDGRRNIFPDAVPRNVTKVATAEPALEVAAMPAGSWFLVMTHSHPLDLDIIDHVLRRDDAAYCGLIGSLSKRRRFERLLKKQGLPDNLLTNLICPIGIPGISGKQPVEIALAVAAELLQARDGMTKMASELGSDPLLREVMS